MNMPKVSVIIPAYNAMVYLPETFETVLSQSFDDYEIIIVNDGSSDRVEQWVGQLHNPRIKLISQKNKGLAASRNKGIAYSQGEYLAFLDADDLWEPTKLEKQVQVLEENPEVGLVYTWVAYINEKGELTGRVFKNCVENNVWKKLIKHNIVECGSVAMVRRSCFETCGLFDRNLGSFVEDWDMWLRIASRYYFKAIKEPLVYYRQRSTSASRNWKAMEKSFGLVIEKAFATDPPELLYLKKQSYGAANLCLAWKALQNRDRDYQQAAYFRSQALANYAGLRFSKEYFRLSIAIAIMRWLGSNGYDKFLSLLHTLRRRAVALAR